MPERPSPQFKDPFPTPDERRFDRPPGTPEPGDLIEQWETRKKNTAIFDTAGQQVCEMDYDSETNAIIRIRPERYVNKEAVAENLEERVYVTDENGDITDERLTRAEVREAKKRYLIVTTVLFHEVQRILVQQRSADKNIDPDKYGASAHGVAKELFLPGEERITDSKTASLINAALETNEELRHDAEPFTFKVWPGQHDELGEYTEKNNLVDPNTIWLVAEDYFADDRYPLVMGKPENVRSRALFGGFVFGDESPEISIDPSESQKYEWQNLSQILQNEEAANDLTNVTLSVIKRVFKDVYARKWGQKMADNIIRRAAGYPKERTD